MPSNRLWFDPLAHFLELWLREKLSIEFNDFTSKLETILESNSSFMSK